MRTTIEIQGRTIEYDFKTSLLARQVRLTIHNDGSFVVTAPRRAPLHRIDNFIREKAPWIVATLERIGRARIAAPFNGTLEEFVMYKGAALTLARERLRYFNQVYKLPYAHVGIRNQKTRWGSCSKKGDLSFSYKIALLPPALADYIIVHELAHIRQFNHSHKFWALVAQTIPNYVELRHQLRTITSGR